MEKERDILYAYREYQEKEKNPAYILTWDIDVLVKKLCELKGWRSSSDNIFGGIQQAFEKFFNLSFPGNPVQIMDFYQIQDKLSRTINAARIMNGGEIAIVSLDPIYSNGVEISNLQTTRVISSQGEVVAVEARPGYASINDQITIIIEQIDGREIFLLDCGAFEGNSLLAIKRMLEKRGIIVSGAILGICTESARQNIRGNCGADNFTLGISYLCKPDPIDWIEARDFIPFVPFCGRVVRNSDPNISKAIPYLLPQGNPAKWASIPEESTVELSLLGWQSSLMIFRAIEQENNIQIMLGDFAGLPLRISYPGYEKIPDFSTPIAEIIEGQIELIAITNPIVETNPE